MFCEILDQKRPFHALKKTQTFKEYLLLSLPAAEKSEIHQQSCD